MDFLQKVFGDITKRFKDMGDGTHAEVVVAIGADGAPLGGGTAAEPNWATTFTHTNGLLTIETRTADGVTQSRSYTYDVNGKLTGIGAWQ